MTVVEEKRELNAHIWEREANEHYVEPEWCSRRLFEEEEFPNGVIHDPCCGFGTIPLAARGAGMIATGNDLVNRGWDRELSPHDFLSPESFLFHRLSAKPYIYQNIVCNPPFNIADKFAARALAIAEYKVAMIFPTARLNAAHWLKGTPLKTVWLMTPRPSMPPGHVIARGEKPGGGKMDYCWLVWEANFAGTPELKWLRRDR